MLDFVLRHLSSQFALFQFRDTGIVEFLILLLDKEPGDNTIAVEAFEILLKIQQVNHTYNDDFNIERELNDNDKKVIK